MEILSLTSVQLIVLSLISWFFSFFVGMFLPLRKKDWVARFNWLLFVLFSVGGLVLLTLNTSLWLGGGSFGIFVYLVYKGRKEGGKLNWLFGKEDEESKGKDM